MKKLALAAALAALTSPAFPGEAYVEVGAAYNLEVMPWGTSDFEGDNPVAVIRGGYEFDRHHLIGAVEGNWKVEFQHISHWFDGPPVNDNYEDHLDTIGVIYRLSW